MHDKIDIQQRNALDWLLLKPEFNLLYIDPPFMTGRKFKSNDKKHEFNDSGDIFDVLKELCLNAHKLLSKNGVICIHVDFRLQHYIRLWLDQSLGEKNFVNQIIWSYKTGGSTNKRFSRKHDYLIVYSNGKEHTFNPVKEKSYNRDFKPYRFKGVEEFQDNIGWYTLVNMKDVWSDIPVVGRTSKERNGYPTQKPLELCNRVIDAFSNEGDLVGDIFCGSGTFCVAASQLNRRVIGSDISKSAVKLTLERIENGI